MFRLQTLRFWIHSICNILIITLSGVNIQGFKYILHPKDSGQVNFYFILNIDCVNFVLHVGKNSQQSP